MAKRKSIKSSIPLEEKGKEDAQQELLKQFTQKGSSKETEPEPEEETGTVRITLDIPKPFHQELKRVTKRMGQTLKGYFLWLAREDIENRKREQD
jgi:hypothetical protein